MSLEGVALCSPWSIKQISRVCLSLISFLQRKHRCGYVVTPPSKTISEAIRIREWKIHWGDKSWVATTVFFSDEFYVNLSSDDNHVRVFRPCGERLNPVFALQRRTSPIVGVIVWDDMVNITQSPLILIHGTMSAKWIDERLKKRFPGPPDSFRTQFPRSWHHSKRMRRWVGVKGSTRNRRRNPKCPLARRLRMVREDTGASFEGAICAWMAADEAVNCTSTREYLTMWRSSRQLVCREHPEPGLHANDISRIHWSQHLLTTQSDRPN
ncbi:uncharacterized protein TNCV_172141 [Trichonephila clavipes]|nr:uncharacterized protein TNCV_172141 [Trichonephila clavipes]